MNLGAVTADFFDSSNMDATAQREALALEVQEDMYRWLDSQEGIYYNSSPLIHVSNTFGFIFVC